MTESQISVNQEEAISNQTDIQKKNTMTTDNAADHDAELSLNDDISEESPAQNTKETPQEDFGTFPIDEIQIKESRRPDNESKTEEISQLADSIKKYGTINYITVSVHEGVPTLVAGERRLMALKKLGFKTVSAKIVNGPSDVISFQENNHRKDQNVIVRAEMVNKMVEECEAEHPCMTIAGELCIRKSTVSDYIAIVEGLNQEMRDRARHKGGGINRFRAIAKIKDQDEKQEALDAYLAKLEGGKKKKKSSSKGKLIEDGAKKIENFKRFILSENQDMAESQRREYRQKLEAMKTLVEEIINALEGGDEN